MKPGSDRLRPDLTKIPIETLIRRAAKARGTLKITGSMTFLSKAIVSGQYLFGGAIDFDRGQSDLDLTIDKSKKHYLLTDGVAYIEIDAELSKTVNGSWISAPLTQTPRPEGVAVLDITLSSTNLVGTAKSWKDVTTTADRAAGSRRLKGVGDKSAFSTIDVDRFVDAVPVEVVIGKSGLLVALKWQLVPKADKPNAEEIRLSHTFSPAPKLEVSAPDSGVVEYSTLRSA